MAAALADASTAAQKLSVEKDGFLMKEAQEADRQRALQEKEEQVKELLLALEREELKSLRAREEVTAVVSSREVSCDDPATAVGSLALS
jgi:hypothetical protein